MSRGTRLGVVLLALALLGAGFLAGARFSPGARRDQASQAGQRYRCPMHPTYTSDQPGECPICHMKLVPIGLEGAAAGRVSEQPVEGRATVVLSPGRRQMLGIRSEAVRRVPLDQTIRTVGRVTADERRVHHVHTKFDGYAEHLYVDFTGKYVEAGAPLLSIYSPDLVATQQEYLLAYSAQSQLAEGADSVAKGGQDLLAAARQRLLLWDISPEDIARLERTGEVKRTLDLHADRSGYVVQKTAFHGMRVTPMDALFDIADLSHLWILADVYEHDLPAVRLGMNAEVSVPYQPGKSWKGPVTNIAPTVDEKTRTIKVRIEVDNRGDALKPDMFADVFLRVDLGSGLALGESAVIDAGDRRLVFLDRGEGRYEPREVTLGVKAGRFFQVLSGLEEGDLVVTSANFLLDSESSLRAALTAMKAAPERQP